MGSWPPHQRLVLHQRHSRRVGGGSLVVVGSVSKDRLGRGLREGSPCLAQALQSLAVCCWEERHAWSTVLHCAPRDLPAPGGGRAAGSRRRWVRHVQRDRRLAGRARRPVCQRAPRGRDRKSTRLNSSHVAISYAVFCLKKKKILINDMRITEVQE